MSAALSDETGNVTDSFSASIRADGRHIEAPAALRHGITTAVASRTGIDELFVLSSITGLRASGKRMQDRPGLASCARTVVCWDAEFVRSVIDSMFQRHGEPSGAWVRPGLQFVSLRDLARPWCRLPCPEGDTSGQYKAPTRDEAAQVLFSAEPRPLPHTTDSNLAVECRIYAALLERKAIEKEAA